MIGDRDVVVVAGVRTPFVKAGTLFRRVGAVELGRVAMREAIERADIDPEALDEVIVGNIAGPADAANVARVIALEAKIPRKVPAFTVSRNCASGIESVVEAAYRIRSGDADLIVAAAVESMSKIPLLFGDEAQDIWTAIGRARNVGSRLAAVSRFRPRHFKPTIALELGLSDPVSGLNMGETAEVLAREFAISRDEQDAFALRSHKLAAAAWNEGRMQGEVLPMPIPPRFDETAERDNGIRENQTPEALAKLKPIFDRRFGTVTAGNSSQITDGAVALVLASGERARSLGLATMGKIRSWGFAGCDPERMGIGPVLASPIALQARGRPDDGPHGARGDQRGVRRAGAGVPEGLRLEVVLRGPPRDGRGRCAASRADQRERWRDRPRPSGRRIGGPLDPDAAPRDGAWERVARARHDVRRRRAGRRRRRREDASRMSDASGMNHWIDPNGVVHVVFDSRDDKVNLLTPDRPPGARGPPRLHPRA